MGSGLHALRADIITERFNCRVTSRVLVLLTIILAIDAHSVNSLHGKPNVIFIMTDDIGYGDLGSYGAPDVSTPNLDRLSEQGARFTDFYANAAACSPTRVAFMTGRYQQRYALEIPLPGPEVADGVGLRAEGSSLPYLLKMKGYATGLVGKWHLGYKDNQSPNAHGFDYFFGFKSGFVDYYQHTAGPSGQHDLWENDRMVKREGYLVDLITDQSVSFIREHSKYPFFLSIQYNAAHWPYQPPDKPSVARDNAVHVQPQDEDANTRADYVAILERADKGIGDVLAALEATDISQNTLVIFTNDNGGEWLSRNAPLFNRKNTLWEGGIRVPTILRWPGVVPAGVVTNQPAITMDLTATILAAARADVPPSLKLDGIDLVPRLNHTAPELERTFYWRTDTQKAVRSGNLKLIRTGLYNSAVFDVQNDPAERIDLTSIRQADARRLNQLLSQWEELVDSEALSRSLK